MCHYFLCIAFLVFLSINASHLEDAKTVRNIVPFKSLGPRIINGETAAKGQFPWQASIFVFAPDGSATVCGGAIINSEWILTAGHCVDGAVAFRVGLGSILLTDSDSDRKEFSTNEYILHEDFDSRTLANDVAVLRLPENVQFNDNIKPIQLASNDVESDVTVTVSGWGLTSDGGDGASPILKFVDLVTISNDECRQFYGNIGNSVVCATGKGSKVQATCEGDSGGPLVVDASSNPVHVGVVSFGHSDGCESGKPVGFARTSSYRSWIKSKTGV